MTDYKAAIDLLCDLVQLDIDAVGAYTSAIDRIEREDIKFQLTEFRGDHERHVSELSTVISRIGGTPPRRSADFKGFMIKGFTAVRSMTGLEGALKAMKSNEQLTNKTYAKALESELPDEARVLVEKNFDDEKRHLATIDEWISKNVWHEHTERVA